MLPFLLDADAVEGETTTPVDRVRVWPRVDREGVQSSHPGAPIFLAAGEGGGEVRRALFPYIPAFTRPEEFARWRARHPRVAAVALGWMWLARPRRAGPSPAGGRG